MPLIFFEEMQTLQEGTGEKGKVSRTSTGSDGNILPATSSTPGNIPTTPAAPTAGNIPTPIAASGPVLDAWPTPAKASDTSTDTAYDAAHGGRDAEPTASMRRDHVNTRSEVTARGSGSSADTGSGTAVIHPRTRLQVQDGISKPKVYTDATIQYLYC
jgi:hypothetical protein